MKEEDVFDQVSDVLDRVAIPENVLHEVRKQLAESHTAKNEFHNAAFKSLQQQLVQVKKKQQKVWDLYLNADENSHASITPDELDKILARLNQEKADIERQLESHEGADKDHYISLNLLLELVQNAGKTVPFRQHRTKAQNPETGLLELGVSGRKASLCLAQAV